MKRAWVVAGVLGLSAAAGAAPGRVKCGDGTLTWDRPAACDGRGGVRDVLPPPAPSGVDRIAQCRDGKIEVGYSSTCLLHGGVRYWMG